MKSITAKAERLLKKSSVAYHLINSGHSMDKTVFELAGYVRDSRLLKIKVVIKSDNLMNNDEGFNLHQLFIELLKSNKEYI